MSMIEQFLGFLHDTDDGVTINQHDLLDHLLEPGLQSIVPSKYKELGFIPPTLLGEVYANQVGQIRELVKDGNEKDFNFWVQDPSLYWQMSQVVFGVPDLELASLCKEVDIVEGKTYMPDEDELFGWYLDLWDFWTEWYTTHPDMPGQV